MSILSELTAILSPLTPIETGIFSETPPDSYLVITPLSDVFDLYTDDRPRHETQEARLSVFDKGNYTQVKNSIVRALLNTGFMITDRRYIGREDDTGYHNYAIDVAKDYDYELKED